MPESKQPDLLGIHHVTAICSDPQRNIDFYAGLLGLRLVKKTVNFDDPGSYHLYYGDGVGTPGTIMTFFAWAALPPMASGQGRAGTGQINATSFCIARNSVEFWIDRLKTRGLDFDGPFERFGEQVIALHDGDGLPVELIACVDGSPPNFWAHSPVPAEHAIRRIHGVSLSLTGYEQTAALLMETMGFERVDASGGRFRFALGGGADQAIVDVLVQPHLSRGRMGIGRIHHVAWRTPSTEEQAQWRERLREVGYDVTPVLDRQYFKSIYFREPGGVLFEIATDPPGFTVDESEEELGTRLKLPPWLEARRTTIESRLPEVGPPDETS